MSNNPPKTFRLHTLATAGCSALLLSTLFASSNANAGLETKTMREALSKRSVDRPLVNGKGWFEFDLGTHHKIGTGYWDSTGTMQPFENTSWTYSTQKLLVRYGISRRVELNWALKTHYVSLQNSELETDISNYDFGDPEVGVKYSIFSSAAPMTSVVLTANYKSPMANESVGNYVGSPNAFSNFVLTTGTPDLSMGIAAKHQPLSFLSVDAQLDYIYRFSGLALYAVETELNQFSMRVKPGDVTKMRIGTLLQLGPLAMRGGASFLHRTMFSIGPTSGDLLPNLNLETIEDSDGWAVDVDAGITLNLPNYTDLNLGLNVPIRGEDLMFFPLEEVHPTYGLTYTGSLVLRY